MLFAAGVRFQSTLPRVERPLYSRYRPAPSHFNPRSREWSDGTKMFILFFVIIFQSTLPRVERLSSDFLLFTLSRFQSTLPRVERLFWELGLDIGTKDFNPRSREWSDHRPPAIPAPHCGFQSTLPRVERRHLLTFFRLQYGYILFHLTNKYSFCF